MTRRKVIALSFLVGLICGAASPSHANAETPVPFTRAVCTKIQNSDHTKSSFKTITIDVDNDIHMMHFHADAFNGVGLIADVDDSDPDVYSVSANGEAYLGTVELSGGASFTVFKAKTKDGAQTEGNAVVLALGNGINLYSSHCKYEIKK